jgi:hypothetical protein
MSSSTLYKDVKEEMCMSPQTAAVLNRKGYQYVVSTVASRDWPL